MPFSISKCCTNFFFSSNNCANILIDCIMRRWREEPNLGVVGGSPCGMGNNTKHKVILEFLVLQGMQVFNGCCQNLLCTSNLLETKKARLLELARYWFWSLARMFLYHSNLNECCYRRSPCSMKKNGFSLSKIWKLGHFKVIIKLKKGEEFVWFSCPFFELKGRRFTWKKLTQSIFNLTSFEWLHIREMVSVCGSYQSFT
jgi:hypothetical protein